MFKDSALHLPAFLFLLILVFTISVFFALLAAWTGVYNPVFPLEPGWLGTQLQAAAGPALLPSVFISLFLLFFRIRKRPGNRLLKIRSKTQPVWVFLPGLALQRPMLLSAPPLLWAALWLFL